MNISRYLIASVAVFALLFGSLPPDASAQARRVPPAPTQKKNKRSDGVKPQTGEPQEAPPQDVVNKPDEAETIKV
ncbi:hypothetical protein ELO11_29180, partial [Klebsiella pneumoniae]|nr:hypothetical protein [Klebsiella pneumoniae]